MRQHPIPRDIGSFKFKLIGNMTVGQFAMLAGWAILAYGTYLSPLHPIIKYPLIIAAVFLAFAFPFLPLEERPLHHWIGAFFRAVFFTELQRVWRKSSTVQFLQYTPTRQPRPTPPPPPQPQIQQQEATPPPPSPPVAIQPRPKAPIPPIQPRRLHPAVVTQQQTQQQAILPPTPQPPLPPTPQPEKTPPPPPAALPPVQKPSQPPVAPDIQQRSAQEILQQASVAQLQKLAQSPQTTPRDHPAPTPAAEPAQHEQVLHTKHASLQQSIQALEDELGEVRRQQGQSITQKKSLADEVTALQQKLAGAIAQREALHRELYALQQHKTLPAPQPPKRVAVATQAVSGAASAQPPGQMPQLTTLPNAINGIIRDEKGKLLSDVIVVIKDKAGLPARALKTNRLGQFVVSTPLENGTYFLDLEKDPYTFDTIEVTTTGKVMDPLTIQAK